LGGFVVVLLVSDVPEIVEALSFAGAIAAVAFDREALLVVLLGGFVVALLASDGPTVSIIDGIGLRLLSED
jgi:hypothetical protein